MSVFRAELTKILTVRSMPWSLAAVVAVGGGGAALIARALRAGWEDPSADGPGLVDPVFASTYGLTLAQLAVVVFAVLAVGGEYATGTVRVSLVATPGRSRYYAGKLGAVTALLSVVCLVTVATAFAAGQAALGPWGIGWGDRDTYRTAVGSWLYLMLIGWFAFGVVTVVRRPALAMGVLLPLLFLGSQGLGNLPQLQEAMQFLPDSAGSFIMHLAGPPEDPAFPRAYGPWTGTAILAGWAVVALAAGYAALRRRDAG
ncbi:ABC transporter permease subunit [Streptomyces sp. NPDC058171]